MTPHINARVCTAECRGTADLAVWRSQQSMLYVLSVCDRQLSRAGHKAGFPLCTAIGGFPGPGHVHGHAAGCQRRGRAPPGHLPHPHQGGTQQKFWECPLSEDPIPSLARTAWAPSTSAPRWDIPYSCGDLFPEWLHVEYVRNEVRSWRGPFPPAVVNACDGEAAPHPHPGTELAPLFEALKGPASGGAPASTASAATAAEQAAASARMPEACLATE